MGMKRWEIESTDDWETVQELLLKGWEPYAVTERPPGEYTDGVIRYYFRREIID